LSDFQIEPPNAAPINVLDTESEITTMQPDEPIAAACSTLLRLAAALDRDEAWDAEQDTPWAKENLALVCDGFLATRRDETAAELVSRYCLYLADQVADTVEEVVTLASRGGAAGQAHTAALEIALTAVRLCDRHGAEHENEVNALLFAACQRRSESA
jgi:hypothetical protein